MRRTAKVPAVTQHEDGVGSEFIPSASDAQVVETAQHIQARVELGKILLKDEK